MGDFFMEVDDLKAKVGTTAAPWIFDVRRREAFEADEARLPTARWRDHRQAKEWSALLPRGRRVVVYCVHGHQVSQSAAAVLRTQGLDARALRGGIEAWREAGGLCIKNSGPTVPEHCEAGPWTARRDPGPGDLACLWFLKRFIDPKAEVFHVEADQVAAAAKELDAQSLGVADHDDPFAAFLQSLDIADPTILKLAAVLKETGEDQSEKLGAAVLLRGLTDLVKDGRIAPDDSFVAFDALYAGLRSSAREASR